MLACVFATPKVNKENYIYVVYDICNLCRIYIPLIWSIDIEIYIYIYIDLVDLIKRTFQ